MKMQKLMALIQVELKKLVREPMSLAVLMLMPVGLTLILFFALGNVANANDFYPVPGMSHFDYLMPGIMGYSIIYMGMIVALALVEYRQAGLLERLEITPVSTSIYLWSQIIANIFIALLQGLIVILLAWVLGFEPLGGVSGMLLAFLFLCVLAISAVGFGLITAAVSKDSGAAGGLSMIFILPMMMFGSLLTVFNETTRSIAKFTPNFYVSDSLSMIFHEGKVSDPAIWMNLLTLTIYSLVIVGAGIQLFKRIKHH
ncbi:MAG: ABC transporter permease [Anaerolineaceae bacterium]|nr:ABC transporter permease [Anaerolineaceae bacterium]